MRFWTLLHNQASLLYVFYTSELITGLAFLVYLTFVAVFATYMIFRVVPTYGTKNPMVYLSICSLVGSVSVMAIKVGGSRHIMIEAAHQA